MTKQQLLLVDGDPSSLHLMAASLIKAGFAVTTAVEGEAALAKCRVVQPDLVLSETAMPGMDGFELCRRLKEDERLRDVPFIFLTSRHRTVDDKVRGLELGEDYLTKPIAVREVVARVRILLEKREKERLERRVQRASLAGTLADMSVVDLIQTLEIGAKTGAVHVEDVRGRRGTIWIREGRIVDCAVGHLSADAAFYRLLKWRDGRFAIELKPIDRAERIRLPTQLLLIDGVRRMDEWSRTLEQLPPLDGVLQIDYRLLSERLAEIPDDVNAVLKLVDGQRTLSDVIEEAPYDDLTTASAVATLVRERILVTRAASRVEKVTSRGVGSGAAGDRPTSPTPPSDAGHVVDWRAGPASPAVPPGAPHPATSSGAAEPDPAPPRIVRFPARPRTAERHVAPERTEAVAAVATTVPAAAPAGSRRAIAIALIGAGLLAVAGWFVLSSGRAGAERPARPGAETGATEVQPAVESNR